MSDLSLIGSKKLKGLIESSSRFNALPEKEKTGHIDDIAALSIAQQEELAEFFAEENAKESSNPSPEQTRAMREMLEELEELERKLPEMIRRDREEMANEAESTKEYALLGALKNIT